MIEQEIVDRIADAGLRLRFDKVALRLVDRLKAGVGPLVPADQSVIFTVTAPIKLPGKTITAFQAMLVAMSGDDLRGAVNGNDVRARRVKSVSSGVSRVMGFIHSPESDADAILDLAESGLRAAVVARVTAGGGGLPGA